MSTLDLYTLHAGESSKTGLFRLYIHDVDTIDSGKSTKIEMFWLSISLYPSTVQTQNTWSSTRDSWCRATFRQQTGSSFSYFSCIRFFSITSFSSYHYKYPVKINVFFFTLDVYSVCHSANCNQNLDSTTPLQTNFYVWLSRWINRTVCSKRVQKSRVVLQYNEFYKYKWNEMRGEEWETAGEMQARFRNNAERL